MAIVAWCAVLVCAAMVASCNVIEEELPSYAETSVVGVGDHAPQFEIESLGGEMLRMPNSEITLLVLFSHTCPDCKALFDELQGYVESDEELPAIMAISRGGTEEEIARYRAENNYTIAMAADPQKEVYYKYATMYVPRCYLIDGSGVILFMTYEYTAGDARLMIDKYQELLR